MIKSITAIIFTIVIISSINSGYSQEQKLVATLQNGVWHTMVNKQIQITTDLTNGQDRAQSFAYIVQVQNSDGVVVSLSWITGTLEPGQSLNPAQSWVPTTPGSYTAQVFVWAGVDNPDALSPPVQMKIDVTG